MAEHYDVLETSDREERERELFGNLPDLVAHAMTAPGWAAQLAGVDPASVTSRSALAKLPLLRKSDLGALQKQSPPFGGFNTTPVSKMRRLQMSPGPIFEPEGSARDFWGAARAFFAAGFREGDIVHNGVHLSPHARRLHHGVRA